MELQVVASSTVSNLFNHDPSVQILSFEPQPAVAQGENYASKLTRLKIKVRLPSEQEQTISVICKEYPSNEAFAQWIRESDIFRKEIQVYTKLLPRMEKLMGDQDFPWPKSVYHFQDEMFVLEDLKDQGYETVDRHKGMDLDQAILTVKAIAKFHSYTWCLWSTGELNPSDFVYHFILTDEESHVRFNMPAVKVLSDIVLSNWGPEWELTGNRLKALAPTLWNRIREINTPRKDEFNVLNHGDIWATNLLFKSLEEKPTSVKMIDYQACHFNSYTFDIHHLLNMALSIHVRDQYYDKLIQVYVKTLNDELRRLQVSPKGAPKSVEDVKQDMKKTSIYGVIIALTELAVAHIDRSLGFNYDTVIATQTIDNITMNPAMLKEPFYTEFLKLVLPSFMSQGTF